MKCLESPAMLGIIRFCLACTEYLGHANQTVLRNPNSARDQIHVKVKCMLCMWESHVLFLHIMVIVVPEYSPWN